MDNRLIEQELKKYFLLSEYSYFLGEEEGENTPDTEETEEIDIDTTSDETTNKMVGEDEIEVDVTELVNNTNKAIDVSNKLSDKTDQLLNKISQLEKSTEKMDLLYDKINNLEKEIAERNPKPLEKLELRVKDSYPFNIKLSDFWETKKDRYDISDSDEEKEYILTKDEADREYSEPQIKKTFTVTKEI